MARTVLLADDSVTAQNMGRRILMDAGYDVITVNNGSAALKKIHESRPDLIVLDVYMPGYGGLEVCQRLKESSETVKIPVLLTVGKMEPFKTDEARRVRADGHIVKPFEASELLAALTRLEDRIVPESNGRSKKAKSEKAKPEKSEKKSRTWHAADPAMTFDDSHSESIAYLAQVKQRFREEPKASESAEARAEVAVVAPVESEGVEEKGVAPTRSLPEPAGELPVVPEAVPVDSVEEGISAISEAQANEVAPAEISSAEEAALVEEASPEPESAELPVAEFSSAVPVEIAVVAAQEPAEFSVSQESIPEEAPVASAPEPEVVAEPAGSSAEIPQESAPQTQAAEDQKPARWVAENVALTPEEAALELEHEMRQAEQMSVAAPESVSESAISDLEPTDAVEQGSSIEPEKAAGATFAAAASTSSASAVSPGPATMNPPDAEVEPKVASEAAAAWKNWEHIRDSVMSPQQTSAIADSVAEVAKAVAPASPADSAQEDHSTPALESAALASIVDTVLAELKPKLMEEIAKKLKK